MRMAIGDQCAKSSVKYRGIASPYAVRRISKMKSSVYHAMQAGGVLLATTNALQSTAVLAPTDATQTMDPSSRVHHVSPGGGTKPAPLNVHQLIVLAILLVATPTTEQCPPAILARMATTDLSVQYTGALQKLPMRTAIWGRSRVFELRRRLLQTKV